MASETSPSIHGYIFRGLEQKNVAGEAFSKAGITWNPDVLMGMIEAPETEVDVFTAIQNEIRRREEEGLRVGAREVLKATLYAQGAEPIVNRVTSSLEEGNVEEVVDVINGLERLVKGDADVVDLADAVRMSLTNQEESIKALGIGFQEALGALMGGGEGSSFGSPEFIVKQAQRIVDQFESMLNQFYLRRGYAFPEWVEIPKDVMPNLPDNMDWHEHGRKAFTDLTRKEKVQFNNLREKLTAWQFLVETYTLIGPFQQLQPIMDVAASSSLGVSMPGYLGKLFHSIRNIENFANTVKNSTEKVAPQLEGISPKGEEIQSILWTFALPLEFVVREKGVERQVQIDISSAEYLDVILGNTARQERNVDGRPLFVNPSYNNGIPFALEDLNNENLLSWRNHKDTRIVYPKGKEPGDVSRRSVGQWLMTATETRLEEEGASPFLDLVIEKLEEKGVDLANIRKIKTTGADGRILNRRHDRWKQPYREYGSWSGGREARIAGAKGLIKEAIIVRHGRILNSAKQLAEVLQLSPMLDPALVRDKVPEIWIKSFAWVAYLDKYGIDPDVLRDLMHIKMKTVIPWKMDTVDPLAISLNGNPNGVRAGWEWPLSPLDARSIPVIQTRFGKPLDQEQKNIILSCFYLPKPWVFQYEDIHERANQIGYLIDNYNGSNKATLAAKEPELAVLSVMDNYNSLSPDIVPIASLTSMDLINNLPESKRKKIEDIDFTPLLKVFGVSVEDRAGTGWTGLVRLAEARSTRHLVLGDLEKLFKLESKYPDKAIAVGSALRSLLVSVNQAIDPLVLKLAGERSENFGRFSPDEIWEALAVGAYDIITAGRRTPKEELDYIQQVAKVMLEQVDPAMSAYLGNVEWRESIVDILKWISKYGDKRTHTIQWERKKGHGAHGTIRKNLEIELTPSLDLSDTTDKWETWAKKIIKKSEAFRSTHYEILVPEGAALEDVVWRLEKEPNLSPQIRPLLEAPEDETIVEKTIRMGKLRLEAKRLGLKLRNPYVVYGNDPVYSFPIEIDQKNNEWSIGLEEGKGYLQYGHRGSQETMFMPILTMFLVDQMHLTEADILVFLEYVKGRDWLKNVRSNRAGVLKRLEMKAKAILS